MDLNVDLPSTAISDLKGAGKSGIADTESEVNSTLGRRDAIQSSCMSRPLFVCFP